MWLGLSPLSRALGLGKIEGIVAAYIVEILSDE
jgi:hypothetical protein